MSLFKDDQSLDSDDAVFGTNHAEPNNNYLDVLLEIFSKELWPVEEVSTLLQCSSDNLILSYIHTYRAMLISMTRMIATHQCHYRSYHRRRCRRIP